MYTSTELSKLLRENACKVTPQRLAIYSILASTKAHPTAETIYKKLHHQYPTMSFATVYKTVEILTELGIIQKLNTGEEAFRYDADISRHAHVRCLGCGRVDDIFDLDTTALEEDASSKSQYALQGCQIYFQGLCPECAKKNQQ